MSINHHNFSIMTNGETENSRDSYLAWDITRDHYQYLEKIGRSMQEIYGVNENYIIKGGKTSIVGNDLIISPCKALVMFSVTLPASFVTQIPTLETKDIPVVVSCPELTRPISALAVGRNYVKLKYREEKVKPRKKAHGEGSYPCEIASSYQIIIDHAPPTQYDVLLGVIYDSGATRELTGERGLESYAERGLHDVNYNLNRALTQDKCLSTISHGDPVMLTNKGYMLAKDEFMPFMSENKISEDINHYKMVAMDNNAFLAYWQRSNSHIEKGLAGRVGYYVDNQIIWLSEETLLIYDFYTSDDLRSLFIGNNKICLAGRLKGEPFPQYCIVTFDSNLRTIEVSPIQNIEPYMYSEINIFPVQDKIGISLQMPDHTGDIKRRIFLYDTEMNRISEQKFDPSTGFQSSGIAQINSTTFAFVEYEKLGTSKVETIYCSPLFYKNGELRGGPSPLTIKFNGKLIDVVGNNIIFSENYTATESEDKVISLNFSDGKLIKSQSHLIASNVLKSAIAPFGQNTISYAVVKQPSPGNYRLELLTVNTSNGKIESKNFDYKIDNYKNIANANLCTNTNLLSLGIMEEATNLPIRNILVYKNGYFSGIAQMSGGFGDGIDVIHQGILRGTYIPGYEYYWSSQSGKVSTYQVPSVPGERNEELHVGKGLHGALIIK